MQLFPFVFKEKEQLSTDTHTFIFEKPADYPSYLAGQYANITLLHENPDEKGTRRYFTLSSSPLDQDITITTRILGSTYKNALMSLTPGQAVTATEPLGKFILPEDLSSPFVFLAGGIGITPFHSILTFADQTKLPLNVTLFVSFSQKQDVIWKQQFEEISQRNPGVKVVYTLTEDEGGEWDGEHGRINGEMLEKYAPSLSDSSFYICGPKAMVSAMEEMSLEYGILPEKIKKENLTGY